MLGWILFGALVASAAVCVVVISVSFFDDKTAKKHMKKNKVKKAWLKDIVKDGNVTHINLDGLDEDGNSVEIQVTTDSYNQNEIKKGIVIYG